MSEDTPKTRQVIFNPMAGAQTVVGTFSNQFFTASDGRVVYLTFLQQSPISPPPKPVGSSDEVAGWVQNLPMIAMPVAKVILSLADARVLIKALDTFVTTIEQGDTKNSEGSE
jgi:hypothetical protein